MVDKWISGSSSTTNGGESGILRKNKPHQYNHQIENRDDLLVFGYACKIFRDDEKALSIDQGKHLIPWMGDQSLKIDRYDVRATLHDLAPYEPPPGGYTNRLDYLSPAEQKAEQLCEEERYFALLHNEMEEEIYQEEELKRLHQMRSSTFGQVGFNYDALGAGSKNEEKTENQEQEEPDEVYEKPVGFDVPETIDLPNTMKEHAIIEKTARFISTQGAQMEILIKTKQSNNPQFNFLLQKNRLNPYYKHVLDTIKKGLYPAENTATANSTETDEKNVEIQNSYDDTSYSSVQAFRPTVMTLAYKPSADCAYTQLISKIKGVPLPLNENSSDASADKTLASIQNFSRSIQQVNHVAPVIAPIVSNPPPPTTTTTLDGGVEVKKISSGLMLAQYYNSDSETECESDTDEEVKNTKEIKIDCPMPPEALQHIIDKTAIYVIKNGKSFEDILKTKDPQRFKFLDEDSEYHRYYMYKVTGTVPKVRTGAIKSSSSKIVTPVSFCIKSKDEQTIPIKPVLPQEASSEEEDDGTRHENASSAQVDNVKSALIVDSNSCVSLNTTAAHAHTVQVPGTLINATVTPNYPPNSDIPLIYPVPSTAIPIISTVNDTDTAESREKLARKIAEDKLRDRLAAAAREKLGLLSKEKQLQLERKKKAMAFINQIKGTSNEKTSDSASPIIVYNISSNNNNNNDRTKINIDNNHSGDNSDTESIHSIPTSPITVNITSYDLDADIKYETTKFKSKSRSRSRSIRSQTASTITRRSKSRSRSKSSTSSRHKKSKKSKSSSSSSSHHHKKKLKRKSRSRSPRSRSRSRERKYHKSSRRSSDRYSQQHRVDRY